MRNYKEQTEKILELVEQKKKTQEKRKNIVVTFSSLAACAVIALLCTSLFSGGGHKAIPINEQNLTSQTVTINSEKTHKMKSSKKDKKDKTNATNPKTTTNKPKPIRTTTKEIVITTKKQTKIKKPDVDKYLSLNGLKENSDDVVFYNGKSYVKTCSLEADSNSKHVLLNKYLGKATGDIDTEATDEITSNVGGKVYTINGYSEDFRLGILRKEKLTGKSYIYIFDNLYSLQNSGISTASQLLNDMLHSDSNLSFINYYCGTNMKIAYLNQSSLSAVISEKMQKNLLSAINNASLISSDEYTFDNNDKKIVLFLNMKDQTMVEIYLADGGYIFCDGLYFKTDEASFFEVYDYLTKD